MTPPPSPPWSRRTFLAATGGTALAVGLTEPGTAAATTRTQASAAAQADDEFAALRAKWRTLILGEGFSPTAEPFKTRLADARRPGSQLPGHHGADGRLTVARTSAIADPSPDTDQESYGYSASMNDSLHRLNTMAQAYAQPGTGLTGDAGLKDDVLTGLDHLYSDVYNENQARYGNWWNWQIGAPQALLDIAVLLYDHLSAEQISRLLPGRGPLRAGLGRVAATPAPAPAPTVSTCAAVLALRGVVGDERGEDRAGPGRALSRLPVRHRRRRSLRRRLVHPAHQRPLHRRATARCCSTASAGCSRCSPARPGQVTDPDRQIVLDARRERLAPFIYNGLMMDSVSGRGISRGLTASDALQHPAGRPLCAAMRHGLDRAARPGREPRGAGPLARPWSRAGCSATTTVPPMSNPTLGPGQAWPGCRRVRRRHGHGRRRTDRAPALRQHGPGHPPPPRLGRLDQHGLQAHRVLRVRQRREPARLAHRLRNALLVGRHLRQRPVLGRLLADRRPVPAARHHRLDARRSPDGAGGDWGASLPDVNWVGGATDGSVRRIGQHLQGPREHADGQEVVVLSRRLDRLPRRRHHLHATAPRWSRRSTTATSAPTGSTPFTVDGITQPPTYPWSETLTGATWAHIGGHGGYVFPGGAHRQGAARGPRRQVEHHQHGQFHDHPEPQVPDHVASTTAPNPLDASYAYMLLPGATADRTSARRGATRAGCRSSPTPTTSRASASPHSASPGSTSGSAAPSGRSPRARPAR